MKTFSIHCLSGGDLEFGNPQAGPFDEALRRLDLLRAYPDVKIVVVKKSVTDIKKLKWRPNQAVDFLLEGDAHAVYCHVHQGLDDLEWDMDELQREMLRLYDHNGVPNKEMLFCPIANQNKFNYLRAVPEMVNNTLRVALVEDGEFDDKMKFEIERFFDLYKTIRGVIIKAPYTTGRTFSILPFLRVHLTHYLMHFNRRQIHSICQDVRGIIKGSCEIMSRSFWVNVLRYGAANAFKPQGNETSISRWQVLACE